MPTHRMLASETCNAGSISPRPGLSRSVDVCLREHFTTGHIKRDTHGAVTSRVRAIADAKSALARHKKSFLTAGKHARLHNRRVFPETAPNRMVKSSRRVSSYRHRLRAPRHSSRPDRFGPTRSCNYLGMFVARCFKIIKSCEPRIAVIEVGDYN